MHQRGRTGERKRERLNSCLKEVSKNKYLTKDSKTNLWYVIEVRKQEYKTEVITYPSGREVGHEVGVYQPASYPESLSLFPKKRE